MTNTFANSSPPEMTMPSSDWESQLLERALSALTSPTIHPNYSLDEAYVYCARVTRANSNTFYMATALMPRPKKRAIRSLYAFCRISDDAVDRAKDPEKALAAWRARVADPEAVTQDPVLSAWRETRRRYHIPGRYVDHLLQGISQDLTVTRYQTFDELAHYCYGVASTVGLMSMHIIGYESEDAISYAIKLGVALQLTNILRDVGEDWTQGRLYLPLDELAAFRLTEADIAAESVDDRWRAFMRFQIDRARRLYAESLPGVALLHRDGRFAVAAAAELYRGILDDIEAHDYDVFHRRAHVSDALKLARLPGIAWRSYTNRYAKALTGSAS